MAKSNHIPKFGNWDPNDHVPYTVVFDNARTGKGGKTINPNDPMENEALFGKGSDVGNEPVTRPAARHQRRASWDDSEFGLGNQGYGHGRHSSRGEEEFFKNGLGTNAGSGVSPLHPQAYGRLGRKPGSASPVGAPGTPNRNRPERNAGPLPKFGDWDVNNPSSGEGFTVIFDKARDERKTGGALRVQDSPFRPEPVVSKTNQESSRWFCRCFQPSTV